MDPSTPALQTSLLYISHFLSMWNARSFEFGAVLFLATIYPDTLLPMSVYALLRALAAITLSPTVGHSIDTRNRLSVIRLSIIGQRAAVIISCALFALLVQFKSSMASFLVLLTFIALVALACLEKLSSIMNTVAVERDWLVVIAGEDQNLLRNLNAQIRRIDLFCKLLGPLAIALVHAWSPSIAIWSTAAVNAISVMVEYPFVAKVLRDSPSLSRPRALDTQPSDETIRMESQTMLDTDQAENQQPVSTLSLVSKSIQSYTRSSAFLPSLALSLLYLTVLSFSGQMTTFLLAMPQPKLTSATIGLLRTASTVAEISATFISPRVMTRIGPIRAGIWFLSWQALTLSPAALILWTDGIRETRTAFIIFILAIISSRIGLWSFDLCAQFIIQESISASSRGSFSAMETSLQNLFELCAFAMTIVFPRPNQFRYPALASLVAIYCSAAVYAAFVRDRRGHLLHMPSCIKTARCHDQHAYNLIPAETS
ncbi:hypothetical protein B0A52_07019 [Exophiala mesophila]|uniref:Solute carrier family 40 member n=1 Tax=Exophiala mesophila TaxID=212818 RepID=A0A438MXW4_EXOME|nr:hypothetical protein B0A52_07019 [Exophiala mesophila]